MKHGCPHDDIAFCPLYHAAHEAGRHGCDDGQLGFGGCAVSRGMDYSTALAKLSAAKPQLVAEVEWAQMIAERRSQRNRNQRLNGIH